MGEKLFMGSANKVSQDPRGPARTAKGVEAGGRGITHAIQDRQSQAGIKTRLLVVPALPRRGIAQPDFAC